MTDQPQPSTPDELVTTPMFDNHLAVIGDTDRLAVIEALDRVRYGREASGVEKPWGAESDWMRWPAGAYKIVLRRLAPEEVAAALGGEERAGFLLVALEPPPV